MSLSMVALAVSLLTVPRPDPGPSQTDALPRKPRIDLFWSDYKLLSNKLPVGARKAIEKEAQAIFAEARIELSFSIGSPEEHGKSGGNVIRIILMPRSAEAGLYQVTRWAGYWRETPGPRRSTCSFPWSNAPSGTPSMTKCFTMVERLTHLPALSPGSWLMKPSRQSTRTSHMAHKEAS